MNISKLIIQTVQVGILV